MYPRLDTSRRSDVGCSQNDEIAVKRDFSNRLLNFMNRLIRLGMLIGSGSRLPAIYGFAKVDPRFKIAVVVSYKRESPKIAWSRERGLPAFYHRWVDYKKLGKTREEYNEHLKRLLNKYQVDLVFGVGWNIIWTPNFLRAFPNRVLNAHPFPLPEEPVETIIYQDQVLPVLRGTEALKRAWEMKLPITGACVHLATETVDVGPIIVSRPLPIKKGETLELLNERHLVFESKVLVEALQIVAQREIERKIDKVNNKKVLIIGSGGREHALGWKLKQSPRVNGLFFAPGNAGTAELGTNVAIAVTEIESLLQFAKKEAIDLTVVGPEAALAAGIVDKFIDNGLPIFGPKQQAAMLEISKAWAVEFMKRHNIPHPQSRVFDKVDEALAYINKGDGQVVVKADGLALGKGVFVCSSRSEAKAALERIMLKKEFAEAGERVVIQEKLAGQEASVMAFSDGKIAVPVIPAQDYKRVFAGNLGPNTGGMGSFSPAPIRPRLLKRIQRLLSLTIDAMREETRTYKGILYAGLMIVDNEPYILEFNCRFGDPETQTQLPLLVSDLYTILEACADGKLRPEMVNFEQNACVCVILTSEGYPGKYAKGKPIQGLDKVSYTNGLLVFHAGTAKNHEHVVTDGGRVLGLTTVAPSIQDARNKIYSIIGNKISFEGMQYRKDVGT